MHSDLVAQLAICIGAGWAGGVVAQWLRQPVIVGYLVAGFLIGPQAFGLLRDAGELQALSEIGLALLMFLVGIEMDLKRLRGAGWRLPLLAAVQVVGSALIGVLIFRLAGYGLGRGSLEALYLGTAAAMSSTVIVIKLLTDKREMGTLAGQITVTFLVFQDLAAILFVGMQPTLLNPRLPVLALTLLKIVFLAVLALGASRYLLPRLFRLVALRPELVTLGALAWCLAMAVSSTALGLSRELGALVAGMAISTFPYALDVEAKVAVLRDFFLILFFVVLGLAIPVPQTSLVASALLIVAVVVLTRLATVFLPLVWGGFGSRAGLVTSLNLGQVSELSLILIVLGQSLGHVSGALSGPVLYAFIVMALASSYGITYSDALHRLAHPLLARCGWHEEARAGAAAPTHPATDIYLLGLYRIGSSLVEEIRRSNSSLLQRLTVVDFNPVTQAALQAQGVHALYGDLSRRETLERAGVGQARLILCTLGDSVLQGITSERLVRSLRALNPQATIIAVAETLGGATQLRAAGADHVVLPRLLAAQDCLAAIRAFDDGLLAEKVEESQVPLAGRKEVLD